MDISEIVAIVRANAIPIAAVIVAAVIGIKLVKGVIKIAIFVICCLAIAKLAGIL